MVDIDNIQDLICNIKDAMKDVFMPRDELNTTYSKTNHTHTVDSSLSATSTNPVQNKAIKSKFDSVDTALNGKANVDHTHATASANSNGFLSSTLFTKLSNIATGATKNDPSTTTPLMDGTASAGNEANYARGNHRHPTDTTRAPTSHASSDTTYGVSSASNYGHSKASATTPKALGTASVGSETTSFARGDHVHPLPANASTTSNGLMTKEDKIKLDSIHDGARAQKRVLGYYIYSDGDKSNQALIQIQRNTRLKVRLYDSENGSIKDSMTGITFPQGLQVSYTINGTVNTITTSDNIASINAGLAAGDYPVHFAFPGSGNYYPVYRSVVLRIIE